MYKYSDIRKIHLEVTQRCNASCPMCDRNQNGGAINPHINLDELTLQDCYKIFEPNFKLDNQFRHCRIVCPIVIS